jgi:adenylate kinase family enzyme
VRRVSVVGNSGSGKTTLARNLAIRLGVEPVELDAIFHQPGWKELPAEAFRATVAERAEGDAWVMCGNYTVVRDLVWARADTVVWLDFPRRVVMQRVIGRTLRRTVTRAELWNGNREPFANLYRWDPERSIIRWAWTRHSTYHERYAAAMVDPQWSGLRFVRLDRPAAVEAFLDGVTPVSGAAADHELPG